MKFTIGDRIIMKKTGEEGIITDYINSEMWEVEVLGIRFPVYTEDIDHPYLHWFTRQRKNKKMQGVPDQLPVEQITTRPRRLSKGVYLSFMPVYVSEGGDDEVDKLKVFLLNETPVSVKFAYDVKVHHTSAFRHEGTLHAFGHLYLHSIEYGDMNDQPRFHWRLADATSTLYNQEEGMLRIKPSKLFDYITELQAKNEATFSIILLEDFVEKPRKDVHTPLPEVVIQPRPSKPPKINSLSELPRYEVDLHIEQLVDNHHGLSNSEIMTIQLRTLERYLHIAVMHQQERMVIIHGVGSGKLRDAVHRLVKETKEVASYKNEWQSKYGFGATEVLFMY